MPQLRIHGISKSFATRRGPVRVLDGLDLEVAAGGFTALRGASGSGKSTLLAITGGLLRPDAGGVTVGSDDLWAMSGAGRAAARQQRIGFVFQRFHLLPYLDVRRNVLLAAADAAARERADTLIQRVGLGHRTTHLPGELSAGEQQRCAIARALVNRPALVLADEPTGNLDPDNAAIVLDCLFEAARDGAAVLLVTHDDRAAARAQTVLRLSDGRCS
jgi:ABC-type lipoprotein export system ATPase subunit